jgi:putative ABC transport system permease protein
MSSELRSATRGLVRWRGGAVVAALTLAIGIGTTTGLYALVRVMLADMPGVPDLGRLGRVYASSQALRVERSPVALNEFDSTLSNAKSFSAIGAYSEVDAMLGTGTDVRPVIAAYASPAFFRAMGVPADGRVFAASDVTDARNPVILGDALWRRQFPDGRIGGATVVIDGVERVVVGVMPPEFKYGFVGITADLWIPLGRASMKMPAIVSVYARLRDGVEWPAAQSELAALSRSRGQWTWRAIPIGDDTRNRAVAAYGFTLGPALLVLLIACVNVACLLMARGIERDKELTVRRALGATRARVIRLLLTENLVLALVSGAIGVGLAVLILRVLAAQFAAFQPSLASRIAIDASLLPVAVTTSALACLIFGTTPALRLSKRDVAASLNGVPSAHRIQIAGYGGRDVIVFAEVAASVGLIVWTAMLFTLFAQIGSIRLAFPADRVVAMRVPARTVADVATRVAALPGVSRATISSGMLGGGERIRVETDGGGSTVVSRVPVGDGFLETLGVPLIRGRSFDRSELHAGTGVAVMSESAARQLTPDGNAIGMRLSSAGGRSVVVIGISRDTIDYGALSQAGTYAPSELYVPYEPPAITSEAVVVARMSIDPHPALRAIAAAAQIPAAERPARPVVVGEYMKDRGVDGAMVVTKILFSFAMLTLLLAASGVFSVISQSVAQRTRELAVRMAIGATPRRVLGMVLVREAKLVALGIGVGLVFTMALTRALFAELVRLNAVVPGTWVGALVFAGAVAALALTCATYRIIRLEPAAVLRRP